MLRAFGFDNAAVLNGGLQTWKGEGRPLSTDPVTYPPATFTPRLRPELIASKEDVLAAINDKNVCIVNALLGPEYTGDSAFPQHYGRAGHIARSVNVPFTSVVDLNAHSQFVSEDDLRKRFADAGALTSDRVIAYCGGAIAASQTAATIHQPVVWQRLVPGFGGGYGYCTFTPQELTTAFFDLVLWGEYGVKPTS
jgi:thiosulfate/3-mercaptopyruvate sulfurtransferase